MKIRIPRQRTPEHDNNGPQCRLGCFDVELDAQGLVKNHKAWYEGGRRKCWGSGEKPKGGAR